MINLNKTCLNGELKQLKHDFNSIFFISTDKSSLRADMTDPNCFPQTINRRMQIIIANKNQCTGINNILPWKDLGDEFARIHYAHLQRWITISIWMAKYVFRIWNGQIFILLKPIEIKCTMPKELKIGKLVFDIKENPIGKFEG